MPIPTLEADSPLPPPGNSTCKIWRTWVLCAAIFVAHFATFYISPIIQITDSHYSMLLGETLLKERTFALDRHFIKPLDQAKYPGYDPSTGRPRSVMEVDGHVYYIYPYGSSLLSAPMIAVLNLFGITSSYPDGSYNVAGEVRIQKVLASILMAVFASTLFFLMRIWMSELVAIAATLAFTLGSPVWSTASRGVWSHTWSVCLTGWVVLLLARAATSSGARLNPWLLGSLLSWAFFVRPTNGLQAVVVALYVAVCHRREFLKLAATGAAWLAGFLTASESLFRSPVPLYLKVVAGLMHFDRRYPMALAGMIFSPSRGLFVFMPIMALATILAFRTQLRPELRALLFLSGALWGGQLLIFSAFQEWWAGHCYGPRYMTDAVPWMALYAALVATSLHGDTASAGGAGARTPRRWWTIAALMLVWAMVVNGTGAFSSAATQWSGSPRDINLEPARVWELRHAQFLVWLTGIEPQRPAATSGCPDATSKPASTPIRDAAAIARFDLRDPAKAASTTGFWRDADSHCRWTVDTRAEFRFHLDKPEGDTLSMTADYVMIAEQTPEQRVRVRLNGAPVYSGSLKESRDVALLIRLPPGLATTENVLDLELPDAVAPKTIGLNADDRMMGLCISAITVGRANRAIDVK